MIHAESIFRDLLRKSALKGNREKGQQLNSWMKGCQRMMLTWPYKIDSVKRKRLLIHKSWNSWSRNFPRKGEEMVVWVQLRFCMLLTASGTSLEVKWRSTSSSCSLIRKCPITGLWRPGGRALFWDLPSGLCGSAAAQGKSVPWAWTWREVDGFGTHVEGRVVRAYWWIRAGC